MRLALVTAAMLAVTSGSSAGEISIDGAWVGAAELNGQSILAMVTFKTEKGSTKGMVAFPFGGGEEAAGTVTIERQRVQFRADAKLGALHFDGTVKERALSGTLGQGDSSQRLFPRIGIRVAQPR